MSAHQPLTPQWDLVVESFDEAAFLWARWQDALDSPRHTLDDVDRWVQDRLLGAIDGVVLGEQRAIESLLIPALAGRRPRRATVAAFVLVGMGVAGIDAVADALREASPSRAAALGRGLRHAPHRQWSSRLVAALSQMPAHGQATVIDSLAFGGAPAPPDLDARIDRTAPAVQRASIRLASGVGEPWARSLVEWGMRAREASVRVEAVRAGLRRGLPGATEAARAELRSQAPHGDALLPDLACVAQQQVLPLVRAALGTGRRCREAFEALVCVGTKAAAQLCAAQLDVAPQARLAADALTAITGIENPLPPPEPASAGHDPDLLLSTPDVPATREAWHRLRASLPDHQRLHAGVPFTSRDLRSWLESAPTRHRHGLATELAQRTHGKAIVTTTTWSTTQRSQLAAAARLDINTGAAVLPVRPRTAAA